MYDILCSLRRSKNGCCTLIGSLQTSASDTHVLLIEWTAEEHNRNIIGTIWELNRNRIGTESEHHGSKRGAWYNSDKGVCMKY